jgi:lipopolysaccharide transport system ATP-binding protein
MDLLKKGDRGSRQLWALKNLNFEVKKGTTLGIIGANGAGKSTLLSLLAGTMYPSEGQIKTSGVISSLLELGAGFHPDFTGRENVYLAGAIMGLSREQMRKRFDAIVDFADIGPFIDQPVKHYSSGMYVRLGFAVAVEVDPDILLVDEVLAVGDASFQQRCLGKMAEVAGGGRTVLFVSHNLGAIGSLCPRTLWLDHGELHRDGLSREVIERYLGDVASQAGGAVATEVPAGPAWLVSARLAERGGTARQAFSMTEPVRVECEYQVDQAGGYTLSVQVKEFDFSPVVHCTSGDAGFAVPGSAGRHRIAVEVPDVQLYPGRYWLRLALTHTATGRQHELDRIGFQVEQDFALCARPLPRQAGLVYRRAEWTVLAPPSP